MNKISPLNCLNSGPEIDITLAVAPEVPPVTVSPTEKYALGEIELILNTPVVPELFVLEKFTAFATAVEVPPTTDSSKEKLPLTTFSVSSVVCL